MSQRSKWLPHPVLSLVIGAVWLLANNSAYVGHIILAAILAVAIPRVTAEFWEDAPKLHKPGVALRLFFIFLWDILVANIRVARLVLGPTDRLRPAFLEIPLDLEDSFGIAILASMITLTPGTLTAHYREGDRILVVHALDVGDTEAAITEIKERYEAPLREVLGC